MDIRGRERKSVCVCERERERERVQNNMLGDPFIRLGFGTQ